MSDIVIGRETHFVPPRRCSHCGHPFNTWTGHARHMQIAARVDRCMPTGTDDTATEDALRRIAKAQAFPPRREHIGKPRGVRGRS